MTNRLLFRPIPFKDETAASILIRAAKENGHASVYQLLAGSGMSINEPSLRAAIIDPGRFVAIVRQLGLTDDAAALSLKRASSSRRSSRRYHAIEIPDRCFRRDDARAFCAACLTELPYWRQQWLVRPFAVCTRHKCLLVDHCVHCKRIPSIGRSEIAACNHCQTSLLTMHGAPANTEVMQTIEELLKSADAAAVNNVLEFWSALERFDELDDSPANEYARLEVAVAFFRSEVTAVEHVATQVVPRIPVTGPRIQLLPFLSGSSSLNRFGEEVLSQVWPLTQIGAAESRLSHLSKSEVCIILKMPPAKLTRLITRGAINWPDDGSRQQKIAITERELREHGFSQTEILYLYPDVPDCSFRPRARPVQKLQRYQISHEKQR